MSSIEIKRELLRRFRDIRDDDDFVFGVLAYLETEEQARKMRDYLDAGNNNPSDIIGVALLLNRGVL